MTRSQKLFCGKLAPLLAAPAIILAYSSGPPAGHTGAPGDTTCIECHTGTALNAGGGKVEIAFADGFNTYTAGQTKPMRVSVTDPAAAYFGFQVTARLDSDNTTPAGTFTPLDSTTQVICADDSPRPASGCPNGIEYIEHTAPQTTLFQFSWTAPASGSGKVTFYVAANAANGDHQTTGDHIYTSTYKVNTPTSVPPPTISENGVVDAAANQPGIVAGGFSSVYGTDFSFSETTWDNFITGNVLPTMLDGVTITVGGKPAAISFVGPSQLNFVTPDLGVADNTSVEVTVANPNGSFKSTAVVRTVKPTWFKFGSSRYLAAQFTDGTAVGPDGFFAPRNTRPVKPGETIELYGTGFGPTQDPRPSDQVSAGPSKLQYNVQLNIGGRMVTPTFAGINQFIGVDQINVQIPADLPDAEYAVDAIVTLPNGAIMQTPQGGPVIAVKK